ncbi:hypothetical protein G4G28_12495 [Massilia sp. Dwa41.01b]|uniref:hypothetical protein n=1 Tax=unclassified Massilia TaxID=2609279 RepID=UPI0015FF7B42|nr:MULTISPECIES: hypothetical protein [unclassified Massilia]QNA89089.1 hypothetical protein G4G28_12495 [Massilia sp. Dwa41.01b]QNA99978.1 hypothetical protein G4G31_16090 [Massilia sp. Se16.2.3]
MATNDPRDQPQAPQTQTDEFNRSENLLPGEEGAEDGRFEVAEEVNLDMQADDTRRVGQLPEDLPGSVTESMPDTVKTEPEDENKGTP